MPERVCDTSGGLLGFGLFNVNTMGNSVACPSDLETTNNYIGDSHRVYSCVDFVGFNLLLL